MEKTETIFFRHRVGDGVHYVNDSFRTFPDGTFQLGDTSDGCILLNLETLLSRNLIDATLEDLWNQCYPADPMSTEDVAYILSTAIEYSEGFDPASPDNIRDILEDLRKMGCPELAERAQGVLAASGLVF